MATSLWSDVQRYGLHDQLVLAIQVGLAVLAGGIVGFERERAGKRAGLRTHIVVAAAAALAVGIGELVLGDAPGDATRIFHGVLTGVGFIGAGAIVISKRATGAGLTTAATVLFAAVLGAVAAFGAPVLAVFAALACVVTLRLAHTLVERPIALVRQALHLSYEDDDEEETGPSHPVQDRIARLLAMRWLGRHGRAAPGNGPGRATSARGDGSAPGWPSLAGEHGAGQPADAGNRETTDGHTP